MPLRKLYLSVWRDITSHRSQFAGLVLMIALGAGSVGLFIPSYLNLQRTYSTIYDDLSLADFRIDTVLQTETIPSDVIDEIMSNLSQKYPIESFENRLVHELTAIRENGEGIHLIAVRLIGINVSEGRHLDVNDLAVTEGRWFVQEDTWTGSGNNDEHVVLADTRLAQYHALQPESMFTLLTDGTLNQTTEVRIIGSVGTAEYLWLAASWYDIMPSPRRFGIMYMPRPNLNAMLGLAPNAVNDICVKMQDGTPIEVRDDAMSALWDELVDRGYSVMPPTPREDEPSYAGLQLDLEGMAEMVVIFPAFILLIAIFSTYATMARLVAAQRQEVGVALALGHSKSDIYRRYLAYGVIVGVIGGAVGILIGEFSARWFTNLYLDLMVVPFRLYGFYPDVVLANLAICIIVCLLGCFQPARTSSKMIPAQAMKEGSMQLTIGKIPLIERIYTRITGANLRVSSKIVLRNIFRNRRRTLVTLIGVMLSFTLVAATAGANDSFEATMDAMAIREGWDIQVQYITFRTADTIDSDLDKIRSWPEVASAAPGIAFGTLLTSDYSDNEVILEVRIQDPSAAIRDFNFVDEEAAFNTSGIVITQGTANRLNVELGQEIEVLHPVINITSYIPLEYTFRMTNSSVRVTGITAETTSLVCWTSFDLARDLIGYEEMEANVVYIKLDDPTSENIEAVKHRVFEQINDLRSALSVADTARDMEEYFETMQLFINFLAGFGVFLAAAIMMTTTTINVLERKREVATVLTLGASPSYSQRNFLVENLIVLSAGLLLGVPMSHFALLELGSAFQTDFFTFVIEIYPMTYIISAVALVSIALIVQWLLLRGFNRMNLAQETNKRFSG